MITTTYKRSNNTNKRSIIVNEIIMLFISTNFPNKSTNNNNVDRLKFLGNLTAITKISYKKNTLTWYRSFKLNFFINNTNNTNNNNHNRRTNYENNRHSSTCNIG